MALSNAIATIQRHVEAGLSADEHSALQSLAARIRAIGSSRPRLHVACPVRGVIVSGKRELKYKHPKVCAPAN